MGFRFQKFPIYQELLKFVDDIYNLSSKLPRQEQFEIASQLRRAGTSSALNLAEGSMKKSDSEFNRFVIISIGSISEIAAILDILHNRRYISPSTYKSYMLKCEALVKQLYGFSRKLKSKS